MANQNTKGAMFQSMGQGAYRAAIECRMAVLGFVPQNYDVMSWLDTAHGLDTIVRDGIFSIFDEDRGTNRILTGTEQGDDETYEEAIPALECLKQFQISAGKEDFSDELLDSFYQSLEETLNEMDAERASGPVEQVTVSTWEEFEAVMECTMRQHNPQEEDDSVSTNIVPPGWRRQCIAAFTYPDGFRLHVYASTIPVWRRILHKAEEAGYISED